MLGSVHKQRSRGHCKSGLSDLAGAESGCCRFLKSREEGYAKAEANGEWFGVTREEAYRNWNKSFRVKYTCQMYVGPPHMAAAEGLLCQASVRVATCRLCAFSRGMRSRVLGAARECVSVSSPSRALGVVVSHGLSLQRQLSCSFPPNFPPHPTVHHPPPPRDRCLCFSLPSPCPAQLSPRGRESPTSVGSAL